MSKLKIVCFGEVLWDMLPSGKMLGGAPLNVAVHLHNLGQQATMISKVGTDDLGEEILAIVAKHGLTTDLIQQGKTHLTGVVKVNIDNKNDVTYKIVEPVAWDYITLETKAIEAVKNCNAFVFGSLSARSEQTFKTLSTLLEHAPLKILDVNLRSPHYDEGTINYLLRCANILKINDNELAEICEWYEFSTSMTEQIHQLAERFDLKTICVTLGSKGALLFHNQVFYKSDGYKIEVADTIGSGDAFLASFIADFLQEENIEKTLQNACAMGAIVATHHGATPKITKTMVLEFIEN